jgi:hypothetical protein
MSFMRVGLLTAYVNNYGACLQAYALQKTINMMGYECEIVRYTPVPNVKLMTFGQRGIQLIKDIKRFLKNPSYIYTIERNFKFQRFRNQYLKFSSQNYPEIVDLYNNPPDYDAFVTGSDQLWNPIIHGMSNNRAYFLDFVPPGKKRIAYAPSIGISEIPEECKAEMAELLYKMDKISVREKVGKEIVESLTGKGCSVVLDPTLLIDKEKWSKMSIKPNLDKPYIFCYVFGLGSYIGEFIKYAMEKTGYEVAVLPFTKREERSNYRKMHCVGPNEFLGLIQNASLIITDSFHATAFSISFNRPFYSLLRNSEGELNNMNSRIYNILELTGLTDRLIKPDTEFPADIFKSIDYDTVNVRLQEKREKDLAFLSEALGG